MNPIRILLFLLAATPAWPAVAEPMAGKPASAETMAGKTAPGHDFYICAATNRNYVVGSVIVTINGVFRHEANGEWTHLGNNDTTVGALSFDPRDPVHVFYIAAINGCWRTLDGGNGAARQTGMLTAEPEICVDPNALIISALPDGIIVTADRGLDFADGKRPAARGKYRRPLPWTGRRPAGYWPVARRGSISRKMPRSPGGGYSRRKTHHGSSSSRRPLPSGWP